VPSVAHGTGEINEDFMLKVAYFLHLVHKSIMSFVTNDANIITPSCSSKLAERAKFALLLMIRCTRPHMT
jgi:hypothetical protein